MVKWDLYMTRHILNSTIGTCFSKLTCKKTLLLCCVKQYFLRISMRHASCWCSQKAYSTELCTGLPACLPRAEVTGALCDGCSEGVNAAHPWGSHHRGRVGAYQRPPRHTRYWGGQVPTSLSLTDRRFCWSSHAGWVSPHFSAAAPPHTWAAGADEAMGLGSILCPLMQLYAYLCSLLQPLACSTPQRIGHSERAL